MRSAAVAQSPRTDRVRRRRAPVAPHPSVRPSSRPADLEIVAGLRRQDARALERLVSEYGSLIAHWAKARGAEAEDVVQDVLFRVWRSGRSLEPDTSLPAWLKVVTQNTIRNAWRTNVRKPIVPAGLTPGETGPDDPIDEETDRIAIEQLLETLSPREREVLRLLYVSDLPLEEVAERLHASREATKSLAARARRHIRGRIEQIIGTAPVAAAVPSVLGKAAEAAGATVHAGFAAAASAAVAVLTAGALTLAAAGGGSAPAPAAPARTNVLPVSAASSAAPGAGESSEPSALEGAGLANAHPGGVIDGAPASPVPTPISTEAPDRAQRLPPEFIQTPADSGGDGEPDNPKAHEPPQDTAARALHKKK